MLTKMSSSVKEVDKFSKSNPSIEEKLVPLLIEIPKTILFCNKQNLSVFNIRWFSQL